MAIINYLKEFWCAFCGRKVKHGTENLSKKGQPKCPKCGRLLRSIPHNKNRERVLTLT